VRSIGRRRSSLRRRVFQLRELLPHLREDALHVGPIEADRGGLFGEPLRAHERGQPGGNSADRAARRIALRLPLVRLDALPVLHHLARAGDAHVAEYMRVPPGELVGDAVAHLGEIELPLLTRDASLEHHLEEQIAQLLLVMMRISGLVRLDDFVRFLEQVWRQGAKRLLAIPWAPAGIAQAIHDAQKAVDRGLRPGEIFHGGRCTTGAHSREPIPCWPFERAARMLAWFPRRRRGACSPSPRCSPAPRRRARRTPTLLLPSSPRPRRLRPDTSPCPRRRRAP